MQDFLDGFFCNLAICVEGEIRLVGGSTIREGRVEVCMDGRWGTVCGEGWGDIQAGLICSTMGFPAQSKNIPQTTHTTATMCHFNLQTPQFISLKEAWFN